MSSDIALIPLSGIVRCDSPITYGVVKPGDEDPGGVAFIRSGDVNGGTIDPASLRTITSEVSRQYRRTLLEGGEILVSLVGTPGQAAIVPKSLRGANIARQVALVRVDPSHSTRYIYYCLSSRQGKEALLAHSRGSVQQVINLGDLQTVEIPVPPLPDQKAIAHILGTLDDKIELNRKTNETLEAMAKALFKSWFVDFDPVRAKAEGRPTRLPDEISDLFPDSLEDSELGEIPSGWRICSVNDLCEWVSSGGTPSRSRKDFWEDGTIPWFKTGELNDAPLLDSAEKINELALGNSSCKLWEAETILFAIYASPTVGRLGVLTASGASNQAAAGLKAKPTIGTPFLRRTLLFSRDELQNIAVGAAQQNINVQILKDHKVVDPGTVLASYYSNAVASMDEQQICLAKNTRELCSLRDALLPKLISGEIRIPDAERMLEEVGV